MLLTGHHAMYSSRYMTINAAHSLLPSFLLLSTANRLAKHARYPCFVNKWHNAGSVKKQADSGYKHATRL